MSAKRRADITQLALFILSIIAGISGHWDRAATGMVGVAIVWALRP